MDKEENVVTLEDLLNRFNNQTKNFINELENEDKVERVETLDAIINDIKGDRIQTKLKKDKFISEIKSGLGKEIIKNPNSIIIHKKPWHVKLRNWFKRIFIKF